MKKITPINQPCQFLSYKNVFILAPACISIMNTLMFLVSSWECRGKKEVEDNDISNPLIALYRLSKK